MKKDCWGIYSVKEYKWLSYESVAAPKFHEKRSLAKTFESQEIAMKYYAQYPKDAVWWQARLMEF